MTGAGVSMMDDALSWLPAVMRDDPYTSLKKFAAAATGPVGAQTDAFWIDIRDLLLYGDQFVNFALTETNAGMVALPTAALEKRYAAQTDIDGLFVTAGTDKVKQDGIVTLSILGSQRDNTPPISRIGV